MKPIFRVFVSSTFADLRDERNALQQGAFLRLERYCEERGARFQAIDLRWGVSSDASLDQRGMKICLQELERCQRLSPRPNFLVLIGDRYGSQPAPYEIEWSEFSEVYEELAPSEKNLLDRWYQRDNNSIPPCAILQPRSGQYEDDESWYAEEDLIRKALLKGIACLKWPSEDDRRNKYEYSATHQEISAGALDPDTSESKVFVYQRKIRFGPYGKYANQYRNPEGVALVSKLVEKLRSGIAPNKIRTLNSFWFRGKPRHSLSNFSDQVEADLKQVIDVELNARKAVGLVESERKAHTEFGEGRRAHYTGRRSQLNDLLEKIRATEYTRPLILTGESGSGKTALLAQLAQEVSDVARSQNSFPLCWGYTSVKRCR